jgi:hypothetical protein
MLGVSGQPLPVEIYNNGTDITVGGSVETSSRIQENLLRQILVELRKLNFHAESVTGLRARDEDVRVD